MNFIPAEKTSFLQEVVLGLSNRPKRLTPKWFYNKRGAKLFEQICDLPEYYLTRSESSILETAAVEISEYLGPEVILIEYGSGAMSKVRTLLDSLDKPQALIAIDVADEQLLQASDTLGVEYSDLTVHPIVGDFTSSFDLPLWASAGKRLCAFFPGSTIGNFEPDDAEALLRSMHNVVGHGGAAIIGVDLKKDKSVLEAAYNDASGISEKFNKNLLDRINRELKGNAQLDQFKHIAPYNEDKGRIEMHLVSLCEQMLTVSNYHFPLKPNETIHTENSYKYTVEEFQALVKSASFAPTAVWVDENQLFSVHLLTRA